MIIYYDSKTGNVKRFIDKLMTHFKDIRAININDLEHFTELGHLVTYTTGSGCIPVTTEYFMQRYSNLIVSVSASGNRNWGRNFAISADKLAEHYKKRVVLKFELSGTNKDVEDFYNSL